MSPPIPPNAKTSALIALARSRRTQRAFAHAMLHRNQPLPTLPLSLGFMTSTACIVDDAPALAGHCMAIAGVAGDVAYVIEDLGDASITYKLFLAGPRQGTLVPCAKLPPELAPCTPAQTEAWMLSTRIVGRRAVRPPAGGPPIRRFALQLRVEPVNGDGPSGSATVTAFLRPDARLAGAWLVPGHKATAIARVTYTGVPSGLGLSKETVVLLTE